PERSESSDASADLRPGQRIPDAVAVRHASGERCFLHELAHRAGHTALMVAGACDAVGEIARVAASARAEADPTLIDATIVLATEPSDERWPRLDGATAECLSPGRDRAGRLCCVAPPRTDRPRHARSLSGRGDERTRHGVVVRFVRLVDRTGRIDLR